MLRYWETIPETCAREQTFVKCHINQTLPWLQLRFVAEYTGICVTQFFSVQNSSQTAFLSQGLTLFGILSHDQIFLSKNMNGI